MHTTDEILTALLKTFLMIPPFLHEDFEKIIFKEGLTFHRWYEHPMYGTVGIISSGSVYCFIDLDPASFDILIREIPRTHELLTNFSEQMKLQLNKFYHENNKKNNCKQQELCFHNPEDECPF